MASNSHNRCPHRPDHLYSSSHIDMASEHVSEVEDPGIAGFWFPNLRHPSVSAARPLFQKVSARGRAAIHRRGSTRKRGDSRGCR